MAKRLEEFSKAQKLRRKEYLDPNGCQACDVAEGCRTGVKVRLTATGECVACKLAGRISTPGPARRPRRVRERDLPPDTIVSREEAEAQGWTVFRTGAPCSRGHRAFRFVRGGACTACGRKDGKALDAASVAMLAQAPEALLALHVAQGLGLAIYRTGEPCEACGARSWRLVAGGDCLACRGLV